MRRVFNVLAGLSLALCLLGFLLFEIADSQPRGRIYCPWNRSYFIEADAAQNWLAVRNWPLTVYVLDIRVLVRWTLALPIAWGIYLALEQRAGSLRRRRRIATGCCPQCGYDLRVTPDRCPECGAVPAEKSEKLHV
jgi:hypothetical protein